MKKLLIVAVIALVLAFNVKNVSAGYITLWQAEPRHFNPGDSVTWEFIGYSGQIQIHISWSGHSSLNGDSSWDLYVYTDTDTFRIHVNVNDAVYKNNYKLADKYADTIVINTMNGSVKFYDDSGLVASTTTTAKKIVKITLSCPTKDENGETDVDFDLNSITISKYSSILNSLTVVDENTYEPLTQFDFSETNTSVKVYDPTNTYVMREYYVAPGSNLTAYLVNYYHGHWYTIQAGALYANKTIKVLRNLAGTWVDVADSRLDGEGTTSVFLSDGALYKFQVLDNTNVLLEAEKTVSPSDLTVTLAGGFESVSMAVDLARQFAWLIMPSDGFLYYNMTNNITVKFISEQTVSNISLAVSGAASANASQQFNSTSGEFSVQVIPTEKNSYAYVKITVVFSDGSTASYSRSFYVKDYDIDTNMTLLGSLKQAPEDLGLSQTGTVVVAAIITLMIAAGVASVAGGRAAVPAAAMAWVIFAWAGWVDWRIVMISVLAGVGLIIRRGEA